MSVYAAGYRGVGETVSQAVIVDDLLEPTTPTPVVTDQEVAAVSAPPGKRVGQQPGFHWRQIPWWGWGIAAFVGWRLLGGRR